MNENVRFVFRQIYERFEDYKGDFPWWVLFLVVLCGCGYIWCVGERCAVEMCWCSSSVGWQGCWLAPRSNPINPLATPGLKSAAGGQKNMWMQGKRSSLASLSPYLRLQASRPLQQRAWSTTPPAWSSHIPSDYSMESRATSGTG